MNHTRAQGWMLVAAQATLLAILILGPPGHAWSVPRPLRTTGQVLRWVGLVAVLIAAVRLGRGASVHPEPTPRATLHTDGPYRFVRHPIYSGVLLFAGGVAATSGSPLAVGVLIALTGVLMAKARFEERLLAERFADYRDYARRTPRFFPRFALRHGSHPG